MEQLSPETIAKHVIAGAETIGKLDLPFEAGPVRILAEAYLSLLEAARDTVNIHTRGKDRIEDNLIKKLAKLTET